MHNQTDTETFFWNSGQLRFFFFLIFFLDGGVGRVEGCLLKKPDSELITAAEIYE